MRRSVLMAAVLSIAMAGATPADNFSLDDFLDDTDLLHQTQTLGLGLLSQGNPSTADHDAAEFRKWFWAARPNAGVSKSDADTALAEFDHNWAAVVKVIRDRDIQSLGFAGVDFVLLKRCQDWYYAAVTPQGPVLIKLSIQFNPDAPMTFHGITVYTKWDEVKAVSTAIQYPAGKKVLNIRLNHAGGQATTKPAEK